MLAAQHDHRLTSTQTFVKFFLPIPACRDAVLGIKVQEDRPMSVLGQPCPDLGSDGIVLAAMADEDSAHTVVHPSLGISDSGGSLPSSLFERHFQVFKQPLNKIK